ncbi:MAG: FtsW/RodA/SpoVE family cell cycle protein [bacterium]|nr:FtsW/RodA/SpoVE family cell cycle protein [bacterium]
MRLAFWQKFDWSLIFCLLFLAVTSLFSLYSIDQSFFWKQFYWYLIFFGIILASLIFNWGSFLYQSWFRQGIYWLSIVLLVLTHFQTATIRGTKSWLILGSFQFAPAELAKIGLVLVLAGFFSKRYLGAWLGRNILVSFFYAFLPIVLVVSHPDFGAAVVLLSIWLGFLLTSGLDKKKIFWGLSIAAAIFVLLWGFYFKPYQKDRLIGFLIPDYDPLGINYNVTQSKIAIGSAGLFGKGFQAGTQTQLHFLPETYGDFIFAVLTEEWGLIGAFGVIGVFTILLFRFLQLGIRATDNYSKFVALGAFLIFGSQFVLNLGSNLGFLPVVGVAFPLLSYGGSSILTLALLMSIILNINFESSFKT